MATVPGNVRLARHVGDLDDNGHDTGGSVVVALDDLTDVTITSPASADRLRYNGSLWVNSPMRWEPLCDPSGSVVLAGTLDPVMVEMI